MKKRTICSSIERRIKSGLVTVLLVPQLSFGQGLLLEEVTVTAEKREQAIQDVGITITAFSGDQIRELGFRESTDIAKFTPGVSLADSNGGSTQQFTIRGVTQQDFNDNGEGPNAVYVDEGYIGFGNAQSFGIFDLERVEILKGPQGTLFGRNATGGLVHFITNKPTAETEGFVDIGVGSFDSVRVEAALNGALSETVTARVAVLSNSHDPILDNDFPRLFATTTGVPPVEGGNDDGSSDVVGVRGHLLFEPNENFSALISASYGLTELSSAPYFFRNSETVFNESGQLVNAIVSPVQGPFAATQQQIDNLDVTRDFAFEDVSEKEALSLTANLEWQFENFTLTSISDYKDLTKIVFNDADGSALTAANFESDSEAQTFAQEIRFNGSTESYEWVAGLYYLNIDNRSSAGLGGPANAVGPFVGSALITAQNTQTDSYSIFGQIDYSLNDNLSLIAGLRIIEEEKEFDGIEGFFVNNSLFDLETDFPLGPLIRQEDIDTSDTLWSGKLQLNWTPTDNTLIFGGINRGVKAGNFNAPFTFGAPPLAPIAFDEEVLLSYEVGFKHDFVNANVRLNGSVYYYDYKDYQVFLFDNAASSITNNDSEVFGGEIELIASPVDNLEIALTGSIIDTTVEDVQISAAAVDGVGNVIAPAILRDTESTFTPDVQFSLLARYSWQNVFGGRLTAQASYEYVDERFVTIRNFDNNLLESYDLVGARLSWVSDDEQWESALSVQNLTDERYVTTLNDLAGIFGGDSFVIGKPRWASFNVRYNF